MQRQAAAQHATSNAQVTTADRKAPRSGMGLLDCPQVPSTAPDCYAAACLMFSRALALR
jgi:hypothetical protein